MRSDHSYACWRNGQFIKIVKFLVDYNKKEELFVFQNVPTQVTKFSNHFHTVLSVYKNYNVCKTENLSNIIKWYIIKWHF